LLPERGTISGDMHQQHVLCEKSAKIKADNFILTTRNVIFLFL
jgi:hypothetical protein